MPNKILFKNAKILSMKNANITEGDLLVIDNRIAYIGKESNKYAPFDRVIECDGNLLMPGFKNAHAHSAMVFLRSKADDVALQDWLFNVVFPKEERLIFNDIVNLNKLAYLEYLSSGITTVFEHYFYPLASAETAESFGMRTVLLGAYNAEKLSPIQLNELYNRFNNKKDSLVTYMIGFHAEYTSNEDCFIKTKEALALSHSPFFTHVAETEQEVKECIERYNMPPLKYLVTRGLYDNGGGLYHGIYLNDEEIELVKKHNLFIVSCPASNAKLASGIAPLTKYIKAGINVALGTDGPASNNSLDMFKEMYLAAVLQKLVNKDPIAISAFDILKMATVNGAKAMSLHEADILAVNKLADLIMIDLHAPNMQPNHDIIANLVYAANKGNVLLTMINGKILYHNGEYFVNESKKEIIKNAYVSIKRLTE